jgi:hypothetical protein
MRLDNHAGLISYAGMRTKHDPGIAIPFKRLMVVPAAALCLLAGGCATQNINKHANALTTATAPVVEGAAAAYQAANEIHEEKTDYDAIAEFNDTSKTPPYNPRVLHPLLTDDDINARLKVLKAFQLYVQKVAEITKSTSSPELDDAATSFGANLAGIGNAVLPAPADMTPATSSTTTPETAISTEQQNLLSTGTKALGMFLVDRIIQKDLPPRLLKMNDEVVVPLCKLLADEIQRLHHIEKTDLDSIINRRTLFIRDPANKLSAAEQQEEILKLPVLGRKEHDAENQLIQLRKAIINLELTHQALADQAKGNNPDLLKTKIGDLEAAGKELSKYYKSLSAQ